MAFGNSKTPSVSALRSDVLRGWNVLRSGKTNEQSDPYVPTLRVEQIARESAGKTALQYGLVKSVIGNMFPSGSQLDAEDPQQIAELIERSQAIRIRLQNEALLPTTEATPITYLLYEAETILLRWASHEMIGHILTNTKPNSPPEWKARYQEYMRRLPAAHVIWVMLPVPPDNATSADRDRFDIDLKLTVGYLREALKLRTSEVPVVVAIVLTRTDSRYDDEDTARRELSDQVVLQALSPLVNLIRVSTKVSEAAIFPTSAYGFGAAIRKAELRSGAPVAQTQEGQWILKPDAEVSPFNLAALTMWTLFHGVYGQFIDDRQTTSAKHLLELLRHDLESVEGWVVPVKSTVTVQD